MIIGYKNIAIEGRIRTGFTCITVGVTYIRKGGIIEFLEGWINPMTEKQLDWTERMVFIQNARRILINSVLHQISKVPDKERQWKGVCYG